MAEIIPAVLCFMYPGTLKKVEFRLVSKNALPDIFLGPVNDAVHEIPQLDVSHPGPTVQLARMLREDQKAALGFVVESEKGVKQMCKIKAYVCMNLQLSVGWYAKIKDSFSPDCLTSDMRNDFLTLTSARMQKVLTEPGMVTEILYPEKGERARVTLGWRWNGVSFSLTLFMSNLESASKPSAGLLKGGNVQLLRPDAFHCISTEDVGVLTQFPDEGEVEVCFPQCFHWRGDRKLVAPCPRALEKTCAEICITAEYQIWGSISAQEMGWGKTPLMAALMKYKWQQARAASSSSDQCHRSTSLVVVPPKVFRQWVNELRSWLGVAKENGTQPWGASWIKMLDGLMVWAPIDMAAFKKHSGAEVAAAADVVVLSYNLFKSDGYPSDSTSWPEGVFNVREFEWDRLILDEGHELPAQKHEVQRRILALKSKAVHVLSGTPQQGGGSRGAASLAQVLRISLSPMRKPSFSYDGDEFVTQAATEFFRTVARTYASPIELPVTEHVVVVQLSEAERVLYAHAKNNGAYSNKTRELLELCCCFVSGETGSAKKEIGRLIAKKRRELQAQVSIAKGHTAFLLLLSQRLCRSERLASRRQGLKCQSGRADFWEEGRQLTDTLFEELKDIRSSALMALVRDNHIHGTKSRTLMGIAERMPEARAARLCTDNLARCFGPPDKYPPQHLQLPQLEEAFNEQLDQHLSQFYCPLGAAKKPLDFLERSMKELVGGGSCPICLDELENGEAVSMTSCGHAFHEDCLEEVCKTRPECPNCRQQITEVYATKPQTPVDPWLKYGSKVKTVIEKLKDIMTEYPGDRVLLYVQYENIRKKLTSAFKEFEVPFLTLCGSARAQGAAIDRWQSGEDPRDFVMVLSCEEHNSGITLTRARRRMS